MLSILFKEDRKPLNQQAVIKSDLMFAAGNYYSRKSSGSNYRRLVSEFIPDSVYHTVNTGGVSVDASALHRSDGISSDKPSRYLYGNLGKMGGPS